MDVAVREVDAGALEAAGALGRLPRVAVRIL